MAQGLALTGTLKEERGGGTPQTEPHVQRPWGVSTPRVPEPEAGGAGAAVRLEGGGQGTHKPSVPPSSLLTWFLWGGVSVTFQTWH